MDLRTIDAMKTDVSPLVRFKERRKDLQPLIDQMKVVGIFLYLAMILGTALVAEPDLWNPMGLVLTGVIVFIPWMICMVFVALCYGFGIAVRDLIRENRKWKAPS